MDRRALSLMRIGIATVILIDLSIRAGDLTTFYTDNGLWPRHILTNFGWKNGYWSLYLLNGSSAWALFLFVLHFIFAVCLLIGYKTRISTTVVWLLYVSLHNRNLFVQQAGDDLLRLVLLWGIFLPWHTNYSIDARKKNHVQQQHTAANIGYLLLLGCVYFFAAILKTGKEWYAEGDAVYYALSLDQLKLPGLGDWLYNYPSLMKLITRLVLGMELMAALFILAPSKKGRLRSFSFLILFLLHLGIGVTLYVGLFFLIGAVSAIGLLSSAVMDRLEKLSGFRKTTFENSQPTHIPRWIGTTEKMVCVFISSFCLIINFSSATWFNYQLKEVLLFPATSMRLDQYWGMFSPSVLKKDGWFVYYGLDSLGRQWDLRLNQDYVDFSKPKHVVSMYKNDRWRKLAENMQGTGTFLRPLYCKHTLKQWNRDHRDKRIMTLNLFFMQKENLPNYKTTPVTKNLYCVCIEN